MSFRQSRGGIGNALTGMATVHLAKGDPTSAERLQDEATAVLRPVGPWFRALALDVRAVRRGPPMRPKAGTHVALAQSSRCRREGAAGLESYRGALASLIDHHRPADAIDIAVGLMFSWIIRGHAARGSSSTAVA